MIFFDNDVALSDMGNEKHAPVKVFLEIIYRFSLVEDIPNN